MGTIVRAGLNPDLIDVLRRATVPAPHAVSVAQPEVSPPAELVTPMVAPPSTWARRAAKAVARRGLRVARPALRPVAVRARTYLTAEVRDTQFHESARNVAVMDDLARSVSNVRESVLGALHGIRLLVQESSDAGSRRLGLALSQIQSMVDDLDDRFDDLRGRLDVLGATVAALPAVTVRLDDASVMVRTRAGFVVCPSSDERLIAGLVDSGDVERGTRLLLERLLAPGDVFVDAGANVGVHTVAAARAVGAGGSVIAFEPFPATAALLRRTVAINGFESVVKIHDVALGAEGGEAQLHLGEMSGHHSLYDLDQQETGTCGVTVVRLDDVVPPGRPATVLKIDVEGAELEVVEGARRVLDDNPEAAVIAEFGPSHLQRVGVSGEDWLSAILRPGWQWRVIEPLSGRLLECELEALFATESSNLLLADGRSDVWRRAAQ